MALHFLSKAVQEKLMPKNTVIQLIRDNLSGFKKERSHKTVHASSVTKSGFCPRLYALLDIHGEKPKDTYLPAALQATFDVGNAVGDLVREEWVGDASVGNWHCKKCNTMKTFQHKPAKNIPCSNYGYCDWKYEEIAFECIDTGVSGSIDLIIDLGNPKYTIVELKIIAPTLFEKLAAPLAEHRIRTSLYINLIEHSNHAYKGAIDVQNAKILYVSRAHGKKHPEYGEVLPFKEFDIKRDDASTEKMLNLAKQVKTFREDGIMPDRVCEDNSCPLAKECSMRKECWSNT